MASQSALSRPSHRVIITGLSQRQRDLLKAVRLLDRWCDVGRIRECKLTPAYEHLRPALDNLVARGLLSKRDRKHAGRGRYEYRFRPVTERPNGKPPT